MVVTDPKVLRKIKNKSVKTNMTIAIQENERGRELSHIMHVAPIHISDYLQSCRIKAMQSVLQRKNRGQKQCQVKQAC